MSTPKYQRLVGDLEEAIRDGRFPPGAKLPSVRELMGLHELSLTTVTTALAVLEERDLVEPRARSGYFVKPQGPVLPLRPNPEGFEIRSGYHWWPDGDLFPRERLRKLTASVVRRFPDLSIESPQNNHPRLQRELAKRCAETGCFVYPDDIMVTHGVTEALSVALRCAAEPGDRVLMQSPVAPLYQAVAESLALHIVPLEMRVPEAQWLQRFEQALSAPRGPRTVVIAGNFHCPTGDSLSLPAKQEVMRLVSRYGVTLIEDDSSGDLHFTNARPLPIKAFDREGSALLVSAATKAFAPGLQVGWIVSGPGWRSRIESVKSISSSAVDNLPQLVLAEFLAQGGHLPHLRKMRASLKQRARDFEGLVQPELGPVRGLGGRAGGYNRFLWAQHGAFDETIEDECMTAWPGLFTGEMPLMRFKAGGISVNLSFPLDDRKRSDLRACARRLAAFTAGAVDA